MRSLKVTAVLGLLLGALSVSASQAGDAPEISRSAGAADAVVVLWPRVVPRTQDPTVRGAALGVQQALVRMLAETYPGYRLDVRPEPERVCPQAGCRGPSMGAVLIHQGAGCAVAAWASPAGRSPHALSTWAGQVLLKQPTVPFREPIESHLTIRDFQPCEGLPGLLVEGLDGVRALVATAVATPSAVPPVAPAPVPAPRAVPTTWGEAP